MVRALGSTLFEVSWEIANKVGGIYTVVQSKVLPIQQYYGERYYCIGPYFPDKASGEFEEKLPPDNLAPVFARLKDEGISCHYGNWLVPGEPKAILIDFSGYVRNKDSIKTSLWERYKIDTLYSEFFSFDEPIIWATAVGRLIEEMSRGTNERPVAQFHEWLSGAALLYLKMHRVAVATVFTTHATMLGRTITGNHLDLYAIMATVDPDKLARELKVSEKHQMETVCAHEADVFTTVSEITGIEAEALLKKKPDVILPNGLNVEQFPTFEEGSIKHSLFREKMKEFMMYYFFPYYTFDLDNTVIFFIVGRYEFHDKGIDIFIRALGRVNDRLRQEKSSRTVVSFFWIPGNIRGIKPEVLENKTKFQDIKETITDSSKEIQERIVYSLISQERITDSFLLGASATQELKRKVLRLVRHTGTAPLCSHDLHDEENDLIIKNLKLCGLLNRDVDRVKVVFYPIYLTGADRLLDLSYYEAMAGGHLGVFPSYYEPYGYTPLEAGALGVASVTTDLAGFGRYVQSKTNVTPYPGIYVLKRLGKSDDEATDELTQILYDYARLTKQERIEDKIQAKKIASGADWKILVENYIRAHNIAVEKQWS